MQVFDIECHQRTRLLLLLYPCHSPNLSTMRVASIISRIVRHPQKPNHQEACTQPLVKPPVCHFHRSAAALMFDRFNGRGIATGSGPCRCCCRGNDRRYGKKIDRLTFFHKNLLF